MTTIDTVRAAATMAATDAAQNQPEKDVAGRSLLPDPVTALLSSGDIGAELAALMVQDGTVERATTRQQREDDEARALAQDAGEVQAIRAEASGMRVQAWVDVGATVVTEVAAIALTPAGAAQAAEVSGGSNGPAYALALGKAGQGAIDGYFGAAQKDHEANAKACEAAAADAKSAADDAHEALADANDLIKAALTFYQEYVSTRGQTLTVAAQRA